MKRNLFLRTDVLPREVPILFNNKNVYLPFTEKKMKEPYLDELINLNITIPYYYHIPKKDDKLRKISLLHPIAQLQSFTYILRYEQMITSFCSKSPFSVRSPLKRNIPKFSKNISEEKRFKKLYEEFSWSKDTDITSEEDKIMFYNYFSYKKHTNISQLYESIKFKRAKYKYNYFVKLDIQNFFPSIYTHSLAWAILGDKASAKKNIGNKSLFGNATDRVCQKINFNETNGLVVGPEFSRVMSELLLTQVDTALFRNLYIKYEKMRNKDYILYRYIDDYFIFTKDSNTAKLIEEALDSLLEEYNLHLNTGKKEIQKRPFKVYSTPIIDLKKSIKDFKLSKLFTWLNKKEEDQSMLNKDMFIENQIKGEQKDWNDLFEKIEKIIYENNSSSRRVVNYFLKTIRSSVNYDGGSPWNILNTLEIITNIYSLDINHDSTNHIITIFSKINIQCNEILKEQLKIKDELNKEEEDISIQLEKIETVIKHTHIVKENLFQNLYIAMKNNFDKMEIMYDILILFKALEKPLNPQFLSRIIDFFPNSYFILCAVGYYIQNEELNGVDMSYLTVVKKLKKTVYNIKDNYISKGSKNDILEGNFFYIINDFSFYPGFRPSERQKLTKHIENAYTNIYKDNNLQNEKKTTFILLWEKITKNSYFEWNTNTDVFIRKIVMKSSDIYKSSKTYPLS